jgi:hypothetical protein
MSPATPDVAFHDLPREAFPFTLEIFDEITGELIWQVRVDGPSAVPIPGKEPEDNPRLVAITEPDGTTTLCFANGDVQTFPMEAAR